MDSKKKMPGGAEKARLKKRKALEDDAAKCAKLTNIFSRRQRSTRELATQGTVTSNIYSYAFGKTLLSKVTYIEEIFFIQFSHFQF